MVELRLSPVTIIIGQNICGINYWINNFSMNSVIVIETYDLGCIQPAPLAAICGCYPKVVMYQYSIGHFYQDLYITILRFVCCCEKSIGDVVIYRPLQNRSNPVYKQELPIIVGNDGKWVVWSELI